MRRRELLSERQCSPRADGGVEHYAGVHSRSLELLPGRSGDASADGRVSGQSLRLVSRSDWLRNVSRTGRNLSVLEPYRSNMFASVAQRPPRSWSHKTGE